MLADIPINPPSTEYCVQVATEHYKAPTALVRAIINHEGGRNGSVIYNKNGSFDMGIMQINSIHLKELASYGITKSMLVNNERCINVFIGTWMIKKLIKDAKNPEQFWVKVGAYNSSTPVYNRRYQKLIWNSLKKVQSSSQPIFSVKQVAKQSDIKVSMKYKSVVNPLPNKSNKNLNVNVAHK